MNDTAIAPYQSVREHLEDCFERVRLLLTRHVVRFWHRITDSAGKLSDLFVSLREVRHHLRGLYALNDGPPADRNLPSLPEVEVALREHQDRMLARLERSASTSLSFPLENMRALLGLSPEEVDLITLLAALQLDVGLHRLATFAWADFTVKHPTVGFVAEVLSSDRETIDRLQNIVSPGHVLRRLRLIDLMTPERPGVALRVPALLQLLCLPDRVLDELAARRPADDSMSAWDEVDLFCRAHHEAPSLSSLGQPKSQAKMFRNAMRMAHNAARSQGGVGLAERLPILLLAGPHDQDQGRFVRACLGGEDPVVEVELWRRLRVISGHPLPRRAAIEQDLAVGLREAVLLEGMPLIMFRDALENRDLAPRILDALRRTLPALRSPVILSVSKPEAALREVLGPCAELRVGLPGAASRLKIWRDELSKVDSRPRHESALVETAHRYTVTAAAIQAAARRATFDSKLNAAFLNTRDQSVRGVDLHRSVRRQIEHNLGSLAEPFSTGLTWDDIVLPQELLSRLREMIDHARDQQKVNEEWGFSRINAYGRGLTALFAGPSGTGKTLCAAIIARELGAELFRVDLSRVVDKYVGETEKNIGRIFDEAERSQAVLLFDEADSLFAKRTGVKSSNDRYANMEVNYLLQRMEHFEGTSILTTNLAAEIDSALQRRLKFRLHFDIPNADDRAMLWQRMIPPQAPIAPGVEWDLIGDEFELAPGHIKNAVMRAAFRAAREDCLIDHELLRDSAIVECRELGFLILDDDFERPDNTYSATRETGV